jgi:hypothetical protein
VNESGCLSLTRHFGEDAVGLVGKRKRTGTRSDSEMGRMGGVEWSGVELMLYNKRIA